VRLLLDTHMFLWTVTDSPRLTARARDDIVGAEAVYVSAASIWEIAIKAALGRIEGDVAVIARSIEESGFIELPITAAHAARVSGLPPHHRDPFDRLLVAQALAEPLVLLTADKELAQYSELIRVA